MHNEENGKGKNDEEIYNSNEYISGAKRAQNGTVPMNILQFQYPFNYYIYKTWYKYILIAMQLLIFKLLIAEVVYDTKFFIKHIP